MSTKGNYKGNLSENDALIKKLRYKKSNIDNPDLKAKIDKKIKVVSNSKTVEK